MDFKYIKRTDRGLTEMAEFVVAASGHQFGKAIGATMVRVRRQRGVGPTISKNERAAVKAIRDEYFPNAAIKVWTHGMWITL